MTYVKSGKYGRYTAMAEIIGTEEDVPELKINKIDNNKTLYSVSNNQSYDKRLLCIHRKLIPTSINKELISLIRPLEKDVLDYRYLIKDQILSTKLNRWGPWICETCWKQNDSKAIKKCVKCDTLFHKTDYFCYPSQWKIKRDKKEREKNMNQEEKRNERKKEKQQFENKLNLYNLMNNEMSKQQLITYHNKLFQKWKIRIQNLIDPLLTSTNKYWIPTEFKIINKNKIKFISDINGLPKTKHFRLYKLFENILGTMLPSFNWILGKNLIDIKLKKNKNLKVIINIQQYQLLPLQTYNGNLHREGFENENVIAGGIYYFDKSVWFDNDINNDLFAFVSTLRARGCNVIIKEYEETIKIKNENVLLFNNKYLNHKLSELQNNDKEKILKRTILCFFLVKPEIERGNEERKENKQSEVDIILSSADVMVNKHFKYGLVVNYWFRICNGEVMDVSEVLVNIIVNYTIFSISKERRIRDELRMSRLRPRQFRSDGIKLRWVSVAN